MQGRRTLEAATAALTGVLLATGCGGGDGAPPAQAPPPSLSAAERRVIARHEGRIQTHCVRVARALVDPAAAPSARQQAQAFAAADALAALAAQKPTAPVDGGQDLRLFLSDVVENLEGSNCDPRLRARLETVLETIPTE